MKKVTLLLLLPCLFIAGCSRKKLDKQTVVAIIKKELAYPRLLDYNIYCSDPKYARKLLDVGLEKDAFVAIKQKQKLIDIGKPLISFKAKAKPYLLPTPEKDRSIEIQKVKLADEDVAGIIIITETEDRKNAIVEYATVYKNITPFAKLVNVDFKTSKKHTAYLSLYNGLWHIEKSPDGNYIK